ncbi:MAG: class I SAM-dependent methyltransferase [Chloroflexi bacterium]|nr:class I SAM-dependent methyltransferase [Chloroflexota bacterium]
MSDPLRPSLDEALASWAARVRGNREQVDRVREVEDGADFYGPVAQNFRADPHRQDEPALNFLRTLARPDQTWIDIGAGGGRYALPLALLTREVIALDPSPGMLSVLRAGMAEQGITNVRTVEGRWPAAASEQTNADVALIAHVSYDIEDIGAFLDAMEAAARSLCVAVLLERPPSSHGDALWPAAQGESRVTLPVLPEFLALLLARGRLFEVRLSERPGQSFSDPEQALALARRQTWVQPGSEKDLRLQEAVRKSLVERDGRYSFGGAISRIGVVTWAPR